MEHNHPAMSALLKLHADLGSKITENRRQGIQLVEDMKCVEAVLRMLVPGYDVRPIAIRRRKGNPWFKRGVVYRQALDILRASEGPMTVRAIAEKMLADHGVKDASQRAVRDIACAVQRAFKNHEGETVRAVGEGMPVKWLISPPNGP